MTTTATETAATETATRSTPSELIRRLAETFPTLRNKPFVREWDALALDEWAAAGASHGERLAAAFVLKVWCNFDEWKCGRFDAVDAFTVWDSQHWAAYQAWVAEPFIL